MVRAVRQGNSRKPGHQSAPGAGTTARRRNESRGLLGLDEYLHLHEEHRANRCSPQTPGLRYCIVRPAIVESSMAFPFPGWNEGFTTSAPLVLMGGEGVKGWPVRKDGPLEIIPVDLVAQGILIVTAAMLCGKSKRVYHLASADENPIMLPRLVSFLGMNSRYKHKHKKEGNRLANAWKAYVETQVITVESLQTRRSRLHRGLDIIHAALTLGKTLLGAKKVDPYLKSLRDTRRQIRAQEITLDKFLPFMFHNSFIFETRNIREAAQCSRMRTSSESAGIPTASIGQTTG